RGDLEGRATHLHDVAGPSYPTHPLDQETGERGVARLRQLQAEPFVDLVDAGAARNHPRTFRNGTDGLEIRVVLIPDVADDLLDQVFERDETRRATVLVDDDRHR